MEKGRSAGSYVLYLLREGFYRMKTELIGWRGILLLIIGGYMLLDTFEAIEEAQSLMFQGIAVLWLVLLFPPRMGKLLYLLPFSKKERVRYLGTYSVSYLVFHIMLFLLMGIVVCLISKYSFLLWMRQFVLCSFPFMLLYSGVVVDSMSVAVQRSYPNSGWFFSTRGWWQQKDDQVTGIREDCSTAVSGKAAMSETEKAKAKKQTKFTVCLALCAIIPAVHGCGNYMYMSLCERWPWLLYVITVLAYVSAVIGLFLYWNRISEEMNKRGSTGKEEGVCNS